MKGSIRLFSASLLAFVLFFTTFSANALSGIPTKFTFGSTPLVLNGAGTRTKFIISVYNAGLFLKKKSSDANQIMNANETMAIRLKVVSGFVSAEKMKEALKEGFKNATGGNTAPIQPQISQLMTKAFSGKIDKGDVFDIVYTPTAGTLVAKNSKTLTTIKGLPFKKALFGIWLSAKPAQESLKKELLGK